MSSSHEASAGVAPWRQRLRRWLPGSIVLRTTLSIVGLSMALGLLFAWLVSNSVEEREHERARTRLTELLSTVETTVQIACFLHDRTLAAEIGSGLMRNRTVGAVVIRADGEVLFPDGRQGKISGTPAQHAPLRETIYSPFAPGTPVGSVLLEPNTAQIEADARTYSRQSILVLALQAAIVAAGVALAVYVFVTRPIRSVSMELHRVRARSDAVIPVPPHNRSDEIGSLVADINALIGSLRSLLAKEHDLRMEREFGERKMRLIFEKAATGICMCDRNGVLQSWNPAFARILGLGGSGTPTAAMTSLSELFGSQAPQIRRLIEDSTRSGESVDLDLNLSSAEDCTSWVEVSVNPVGQDLLEAIVNDISERKRQELKAQRDAAHDPLTGLLNRRGMELALAAAFTHPAGETFPGFAVLQIDLDYFKEVNDTYGHEAGDCVLRHVARSMERILRRGDPLARPGGDEFLAVLPGMRDPDRTQDIARALIREISQPIELAVGGHAHVGASVGIAVVTSSDESSEAVLRRADAALYLAKQSGRGRVCLAPEPLAEPESGAAA